MVVLTIFQKIIDVVKMDIESYEWGALNEMVLAGTLRQVRQLLVEYHGDHTEERELIDHLGILKDIYDLGFRKFLVHKNDRTGFNQKGRFPVVRTSCYEVHYVNIFLRH